DGGGARRGEVEDGGIGLSGGDIVDDVGTGGQGLPRDSGAHRVDADHRAGGGELTDDGHDAAQLFVLIDADGPRPRRLASDIEDRKSTRLNSSHVSISYAVFCLKKNTRGTSAACRNDGLS